MLIEATSETYLKKAAVQSSELADNQKIKVPAGKEYQILTYAEADDGHYRVELDYRAGTWYIWSDHWRLPWEDHQEVDNHVCKEFFTPENLRSQLKT